MKSHKGSRNLTKVLFTASKDKKALTTIMKENVRFTQLQLNYLNKKKGKRTPKIINKLY